MGQDLCRRVDCCQSAVYQQAYIIMPKDIAVKQEQQPSAQTERQIETLLAQEQMAVNQGDMNPKAQQLLQPETNQTNQISDLLPQLTDIRSNFMDVQKPKEIYLSIDEVWKNEMKLIQKPMEQYYTKISENEYTRNLEYNSKFQMLFRQHFPKFGVFFYQINVASYLPKNGCELIVGVIDYIQALKLFHCKGSLFQQSFIFNISKDFDSQSTIQRLNIVLRVQVNRQTNKLSFYVDERLEQSKDLKAELLGETASLVPFIQTQVLGVTFSWRESPISRTANYRLSTIIQEQSSIHITH